MEMSQIINLENKPVPTKAVKVLGEDYVWISQKNALNGNEVTLYETNLPFILDYAEFSGKDNLSFSGPYIYSTIGGTLTQISRCLNADASIASPALSTQFSHVYNHGSTMFEVYSYDALTATAKVALKRPMFFPNGVKITVKCSSGTSTVAAVISGRVVK